jgi:putative CocE/NonD family hydrolase
MPALLLHRTLLVAAVLCNFLPLASAQTPATLPSESPATLVPTNSGFNYDRREVMIPMRDGVKLHTVILVPKGAKGAAILLTRTPYSATALTTNMQSAHLGSSLYGYDNATDVIVDSGYIRVIQDVRGKYGSEGDYVMNRPLHGPLNPTKVDHATDTWDTIDWLVKNTPESNGKVGIIGISYDGFTTLMGLVHPHPALKVAVPMNPMVDGWQGRCAPKLRRLLAGSGCRQDPRRRTDHRSHTAGPQPMGRRRHLRRHGCLQSHQAQRHR